MSIKLTKDLITVTTPPTTVVTQYPATTSTSTAPARLTDVKYAYFSDSLYNGLLFDYAIQSPDSSGSATSFDELGNEITGYYLTFYTAIIGGFIPVSRIKYSFHAVGWSFDLSICPFESEDGQ